MCRYWMIDHAVGSAAEQVLSVGDCDTPRAFADAVYLPAILRDRQNPRCELT